MPPEIEPPVLDAQFYDLTQSLWGAFAGAMSVVRARETEPPPVPLILQLRAGLAESPGWFLIQAAEFDPEPLSVECLRIRDVYASERIVAALLDLMASEKWLDEHNGEYTLRAEGRAVLDRLHANRYRWLGELALPDAADRLESRFHQLINASLSAPSPPGVWCLAHSRNRAPAESESTAAKLFQYVADINAFRDDCHMAAWQPLNVAGYVWEAFGLVASGSGPTADALFDALAYRGYSVAEYAAALAELVGRGWLRSGANGYSLSDEGQAVRNQVERATDDYFYAPWADLSAADVMEIRDDIHALRASLERLGPPDGPH